MFVGILSIAIVLIVAIGVGLLVVKHLTNAISREFKYHFDAFKFKATKTGEVIPLIEYDFSKSGIPTIEVKMQGKTFKFMLDSGANINVFDKSAFDILDSSNLDKEASKGFTTASGELQDDIFKSTLEFKHKQRKFNETFEVLDMSGPFNSIEEKDGVKIHGILGSKFFKHYQWTIDFENLVVWIK